MSGRLLGEVSLGLTLRDRLASRASLVDINGDQRLDLTYFKDCDVSGACSSPNPVRPGGRYPLRARVFGINGFENEIEATSGSGISTIANQNPDQYLSLFIDTNGDGAADLLRYRADGSSSNNLYATNSSLPLGGHEAIWQIQNGLGARHEISYASLVYNSMYQRAFDGPRQNWGRGSPVFDVFSPLWAVREVRSSAPTPTGCDADDSVCDSQT